MARLILIDNASGYIVADTACLPPHTFDGETFPVCQSDLSATEEGAVIAVRWFAEAVLRRGGGAYGAVLFLSLNDDGYLVYQADIDGSEAVPVVHDGQDQETINAVQDTCKRIAVVRRVHTVDA